ncbi:hypothetical protein CC2G_009328 [Coprinopsis cinerea AmutBmut pab1-1]|nr:hypothetical protein CC2G_009328 [Coprinopsis cinerea AmutBmut pab1-1]
MTSRKSPLRDRLLSNSPDPIKSSILRESGMGWNTPNVQATGSISSTSSSSSSSITSPLRISKRDSPARPRGPGVARRSSSSYKHMHNNNLVSKSPFKSQIPTPSTPSSRPAPIAITFPTSTPTRRVSSEKRPRPASLHEQGETENERPFSLKRDRKQSKGLEKLLEKEPVSKSPFKLGLKRSPSDRNKSSPIRVRPHSYIPTSATPSRIPTPARSGSAGPSPGRSVLVSRRMHGPRRSGSFKRERRKTVTFDERCDVVEFDRDETDEEGYESYTDDEEGSFEERNEEAHDIKLPNLAMDEDSNQDNAGRDGAYDSNSISEEEKKVDSLLNGDPDASITGIVDEMFFSPNGLVPGDTSVTSFTNTPPRHSGLPADLETEDGVPLGRSHHVERFLQHQQHHSPRSQPPHFSPRGSPQHGSPRTSGLYPFNLNLPTHASPHGPPVTPPRRAPGMMHSTPPLGRSTHAERIQQIREDEREAEAEGDVNMMPPSPSPGMKPTRQASVEDALVPRFDIGQDDPTSRDASVDIGADPFERSRLQDESAPAEISTTSTQENKSANVSVGSADVDLSHLLRARTESPIAKETLGVDGDRNEEFERSMDRSSSFPDASYGSPNSSFQGRAGSRAGSPFTRAVSASPLVRGGSPLTRVSSPHLGARQSPTGLRPRISKEDVQRRLLGRRSFPSPSNSPEPTRSRQSPAPEPAPQSQPLLQPAQDDNRDRLSIMTGMTDISTETAIVTQAERVKVSVGSGSLTPIDSGPETEFGARPSSERLGFDFGSKFGLGGLGISTETSVVDVTVDEVSPTASEPQSATRPGFTERTGMRMGDKDVDMDMKSALDRLMEDVAGGPVDDSLMTDDSFISQDSQASTISVLQEPTSRPKVLERAATDTALLHTSSSIEDYGSRTVSGSSTSTLPPPVPPKDSIKNREQLILEKRREARRMMEDSEDEENDDSFEAAPRRPAQRHLGVGRPSRRRSMSTGDAEDLGTKRRGEVLLDIAELGSDSLLGHIEKELNKAKEEPKKTRYQIREHRQTIYASSSHEKVSHNSAAGDVDAGRAWRTVRRPSDMNEYAKQIREYRAQDKGKAYGKVFVKVLAIKGVHLPLPRERTAITCTLNNGIHFVTTPECQLGETSAIEQEFELIEHSKLEFTLTIKVRRDPHIAAQFQALAAPPAAPIAPVPIPPPMVQTASKSSGMFSLFSSSPRKKDKHLSRPPPAVAPPPPQPSVPHRLPENLARYLKPDGTMARAFVCFKDIVHRCDTRLFETSYPLIGQRAELGGKFSTQQVGEIVLQMFRLPPLPGIPQDQLPQSLEECHRGLRHINWHKMTYFQGTLTQNGGDCSTWRRRQFRVIGGSLVAFNDVTKKATATIDLKKAIALEDDAECKDHSRYETALYGVERSFRLIFPDNEEIMFFADTDEEKSRWLDVLRALVGHIPPHPLWAELLWQRQEELTKRAQAARQVAKPYDPSTNAQQSR